MNTQNIHVISPMNPDFSKEQFYCTSSPSFYHQVIENSLLYSKHVLPNQIGYKNQNHDPTDCLRHSARMILAGEQSPYNTSQFDVTVKNLTAVGTSLPDLIKFGSKIDWSSLETFKLVLSYFTSWYFAHCEKNPSVDCEIRWKSLIVRDALEKKLHSYWCNQRKRLPDFLFQESCEVSVVACNSDSDVDVAVDHLPVNTFDATKCIRKEFSRYTRQNQDETQFCVALHRYEKLHGIQWPVGKNDKKKLKNQLRTCFTQNIRRRRPVMNCNRFARKQTNARHKADDMVCKEHLIPRIVKENTPADLFKLRATIDRRTRSCMKTYKHFKCFKENPAFMVWEKGIFKAGIENNKEEHDAATDDEQTLSQITNALKELALAVQFFVVDDPLKLVANLSSFDGCDFNC